MRGPGLSLPIWCRAVICRTMAVLSSWLMSVSVALLTIKMYVLAQCLIILPLNVMKEEILSTVGHLSSNLNCSTP
jgi:hypothetical protein